MSKFKTSTSAGGLCLILAIAIPLGFAASTFFIHSIWGLLFVPLFGWPQITWLQAFGFALLLSFLGSFFRSSSK